MMMSQLERNKNPSSGSLQQIKQFLVRNVHDQLRSAISRSKAEQVAVEAAELRAVQAKEQPQLLTVTLENQGVFVDSLLKQRPTEFKAREFVPLLGDKEIQHKTHSVDLSPTTKIRILQQKLAS